MERGRTRVCEIISEMLDNPDKTGIYPTGKAYNDLIEYVHQERFQVLGWMHAEACTSLDRGIDIRKTNVPMMLDRAKSDLEKTIDRQGS